MQSNVAFLLLLLLISQWLSISGMAILQYNQVSYQMLATCFPDILWPFVEFSQRLKIEGDSTFGSFQLDFLLLLRCFNSISPISSYIQASL